MALPVAPAFARSFLALLKENEVGPQVQSYLLRVGCLTVQQMYGRCDDVTEIQANIIAGAIPNPDDSSATLELQLLEKSKLKHVWLQCEALVKHELEKLATGRTDDELDDAPLSRDDYLMVTGAFKAKYDWSLPASRTVGDGLLGKIRRQFQKECGVSHGRQPYHVFGRCEPGPGAQETEVWARPFARFPPRMGDR